jgi:hypothetical protein
VVADIYNPNHQRSRWWRLLSHGAPDSLVRHRTLFGAPATSPGRWVLTVGASDIWAIGQSGATPDSLVNYSGAAPRIPEGGKFTLEFPGAPDTVRWHTGQSGAPDQGTLRLSFALFV